MQLMDKNKNWDQERERGGGGGGGLYIDEGPHNRTKLWNFIS